MSDDHMKRVIARTTTDLTASLEARRSDLTGRERDRWETLRFDVGRIKAHPEQLRTFEERTLAALSARDVAAQQPAILTAPVVMQGSRREEALRLEQVRLTQMRMGERPLETVSAKLREREGALALGDLLPLDGTFLLTPSAEQGERKSGGRWDVDSIKQGVDLQRLVGGYGVTINGYQHAQCFVCHSGSKQSMSIRKETARCFVCGWQGDAISTVMQLEQCDFNAACEILGGTRVSSGATYTPPAHLKRKAETEFNQRDLTPLVDAAHTALLAQGTETARQAMQYLEGRGFYLEDVHQFRFGIVDSTVPTSLLPITREGNKPSIGWRNRITVPDLDREGRVVTAKARLFLPQPEPKPGDRRPLKYLGPAGVSPSPFRFGMLPQDGDVLLVEGELDALTVASCLTPSVIAVPGVNNLRPEHAQALAERGGRVYLLLDPDVDLTGAGGDDQRVDARPIVNMLRDAGCDLWLVPPLSAAPDDDLNTLLQRCGGDMLSEHLALACEEAKQLAPEPGPVAELHGITEADHLWMNLMWSHPTIV